jgi:opacity protein-like surface antigen
MRKLLAVALPALVLASAVLAQPSAFIARLDWVPISGAERNDVGGTGTISAELSRSDLKITGSFEALPTRATRAALHQGVATGARGPEIAGLAITPGPMGTVSGSVTLTPEQHDALLAGRLYVQLHAERGVAPDNAVLWGWLLPPRGSAR